jgi:AhpC/TSA family protein
LIFLEHELTKIGRDYADTGLGIIGISSNDPVQYPDDAPPRLKEMAERLGFTFPFCFDDTQDVAQAYRAACTQDFYLFDRDRRLLYRGQLDDSRPGSNKPVTGRDLRAAIDAALAGKPVDRNQKAMERGALGHLSPVWEVRERSVKASHFHPFPREKAPRLSGDVRP